MKYRVMKYVEASSLTQAIKNESKVKPTYVELIEEEGNCAYGAGF